VFQPEVTGQRAAITAETRYTFHGIAANLESGGAADCIADVTSENKLARVSMM